MATTAEGAPEGETKVMGEEDKIILQFLDSLDGYIASMASLSSLLRQGWFQLAGARHAVGSSRISSAVFDLKPHFAGTIVHLDESTGIPISQPHFNLSKWGNLEDQKDSYEDGDISVLLQKEAGLIMRHQNLSGLLKGTEAKDDSTTKVDDLAQQRRSKALSIFGAFPSPKLRNAQVSFEAALESIVEMANRRSVVLSSFERLQLLDNPIRGRSQMLRDTQALGTEPENSLCGDD